ncbi:MAG TPA: type II secretion system protein GspG [Sedimenticola sp.]|nr:type II secretion system protein GspG [Sedimenticola sp.]
MHASRHRYKGGKPAPSGFTLIEVMVVVVILSILAAIVVPKIMSRPDEARITRVQQDIRALSAALDLYRLDNFSYPTTDQGLEALVTRPGNLPNGARWKEGGYIDRVPKDPWGNPYNYLQPGTNGEFDLYSLGADNAPGGEGVNADIGNWTLE